MKIAVCLKQILDPEIPARDFKVDAAKREAEQGGANLVTNIFCENALETALQIRDAAGSGEIVAISVGPSGAEDVLRKALALRADQAVLVVNEADSNPDPLFVAKALAAAIKKVGGVDVVMVGREAGDWGAGQTGGLLAEELGIPCISFAEGFEPGSRTVKVKRQTDAGFEVIEAPTPLVVTITNHDKNVPRIPKTRDVMQSYRKPLEKWSLADLGVDTAATHAYSQVAELFIPKKETKCEFIEGDTIEAKVDALAKRIGDILRAM
jgi:electron transfer flavoprotein beta subunit